MNKEAEITFTTNDGQEKTERVKIGGTIQIPQNRGKTFDFILLGHTLYDLVLYLEELGVMVDYSVQKRGRVYRHSHVEIVTETHAINLYQTIMTKEIDSIEDGQDRDEVIAKITQNASENLRWENLLQGEIQGVSVTVDEKGNVAISFKWTYEVVELFMKKDGIKMIANEEEKNE